MIEVYVNTVFCAMLFYTCFCRLVRTNSETFVSIRLAFIGLAAASVAAGLAPLMGNYRPEWPVLVIEGAMTGVQAITALHWRDGVPSHFQKGCRHGSTA